MTTVEQRLTRLERQQQANKNGLAEVRNRLGEVETDIQESEDRQMAALADLKKVMETRLDHLESRLDSLARDIKSIAGALYLLFKYDTAADERTTKLVTEMLTEHFDLQDIFGQS